MPDFAKAQARLAKARADRGAAKAALAKALVSQKQLAAQQAGLVRRLNGGSARAERDRFAGLGKNAGRAVAAVKADLQASEKALKEAMDDFAPYTDPRKGVFELSDRSPFLLFPLRVETRFATVGKDNAPRHQLWVRIFPDDCSVDTFEPDLSATEISNAQRYWRQIWQARGVEAVERAAWRDLVAAHGSGRAGWIVDHYRPRNLGEKPATADAEDVDILFPPDPPTKLGPWTQAPRVNHLADRFVVMGYAGGQKVIEALGNAVSLPLIVGPDPSAAAPEGIYPQAGNLSIPDELKWLVDFDSAVKAGMGLRIDLTPDQARRGFDRLLVLGLQISTNDTNGAAALTELLQHHHHGRSGLAVLPQGAPTHNSTGDGSGFTSVDDPDVSFDDRKQVSLFNPTPDFQRKQDGQWLAELLGIDPATFAQVHGAGGTDQMHSRAMQRALWPATLGYWMDKLMMPVFDDDTVERTHLFFTNFVTGRGCVPPIRIGRQPYGILPTTAFSQIRWFDQTSKESAPFLGKLYRLLRSVDADWTALSQKVSFVGKGGDAHQMLLDIVGLHPTSVEFHSRDARSVLELYNTVNFWGEGPDLWQKIQGRSFNTAALALLFRLGYAGGKEPDILRQIFSAEASQLQNIIDDRPPSETDQIRPYTDNGRNYIRWLIDAAKTSLDALNQEMGFSNDQTPRTVLYLMLRHALLLAYYDASYSLHRDANILTERQLLAMKPEPIFVHVDITAGSSESRWAALFKTEPRITNDPRLSVADYISQNIGRLAETRHLSEQLDALDVLSKASTASLERAFAEHVDCCSYRYDAWLLGLVNLQLQMMRYASKDGAIGVRQGVGVYLGAYAWLEDLRPSPSRLDPADVPADLANVFIGKAPIMSDSKNGGYIHAPSLAHAHTAAVLRSAYLANATPTNPETMAINLSSDRVRAALAMLEGIRNGQSLGALLGYRFERGLHDDHDLAEVDKFIYPLRQAFPLVANQLKSTRRLDVPIQAVEARNVLDGVKLREHVTKSGARNYPFGLRLPAASPAEAAAIDAEVNALLDVYDAIGDLALAEGVHQAVQGNFDRLAGTLASYTTGNYPPDPFVIQTPPSGVAVTHRIALHLKPGLIAPPNATPRSTAEPALDAWLAGVLPSLDKISCTVTWDDPVTNAAESAPVTMEDIGLRALDLFYLVKPDAGQAMTELDDRIIRFVVNKVKPRPDAILQIRYMTAGAAGEFSIFEVSALVRALRTVVTHSRPLRASDASLHGTASPEQDANLFIEERRISRPKQDLDSLRDDINTFLTQQQPMNFDDSMGAAVDLLERAARFNIPQSGWGFVYAWKRAQFSAVLASVGALVTHWEAKLADYDARLAAYEALPPTTSDNDRFAMLRRAELIISTTLTPAPASPAALRAALDRKRAEFVARLAKFRAVRRTRKASFSSVLAAVRRLLPISDFDLQELEIRPFQKQMLVIAADVARVLQGQLTAIDQRRAEVQAKLDAADIAGSAAAKVEALQEAAQALLGDEFRIIPEFKLSDAQGTEWENALTASRGGALLDYLKNTAKFDFPVDEWLYGAARVRPALRAWEQILMLTGAFERTQPELMPIQFPYEPEAPWVAMQFPPDYSLDSDRLLYTAHYAAPFDKAANQCGLLLDAWTETIPSDRCTTGVTFNFDRPENEPPQALLLVTPASATGAWQWQDLVGALDETLDLAKKRAVEPVHMDNSAYPRLLPATVMASMYYGISIATSLAAVNGAFIQLGSRPNA